MECQGCIDLKNQVVALEKRIEELQNGFVDMTNLHKRKLNLISHVAVAIREGNTVRLEQLKSQVEEHCIEEEQLTARLKK